MLAFFLPQLILTLRPILNLALRLRPPKGYPNPATAGHPPTAGQFERVGQHTASVRINPILAKRRTEE